MASLARHGAKVTVGSLSDAQFVKEATRGALVLFWLTPPNSGVDSFREYQRRLGAIAAEAFKTSYLPRVVNLSNIEAQHGHGGGPVNGLHDVEHAINQVAEHVTHLRPGTFMEAYPGSVGTIKSASSVFSLSPDRHGLRRSRPGTSPMPLPRFCGMRGGRGSAW